MEGAEKEMNKSTNEDFQKIPKEQFISDWSAGYQEGLIAGIKKGKDKLAQAIKKGLNENIFWRERDNKGEQIWLIEEQAILNILKDITNPILNTRKK